MPWSLIKVLKSAFLYSPFYNLYGSLYLNESSNEIVAVKTSYTNKFGYADFVVTKNDQFDNNFMLNYKYEEISLKKFENHRGSTYLINDESIFNHMSDTNITHLVETYKMNEDKFKSSCYNIYNIDNLEKPKNLYRNNRKNKPNISYSYSYLKCTKSHLHLSENIWPKVKFMGRIRKGSRRKTVVSICMEKCIRRGYNKYFAIDSGNICWCSKRNKQPPMKDTKNICLKCSDDIYSTCGNVNYGFMSIYKIISDYTSKAKRPTPPSPTQPPTPSPTDLPHSPTPSPTHNPTHSPTHNNLTHNNPTHSPTHNNLTHNNLTHNLTHNPTHNNLTHSPTHNPTHSPTRRPMPSPNIIPINIVGNSGNLRDNTSLNNTTSSINNTGIIIIDVRRNNTYSEEKVLKDLKDLTSFSTSVNIKVFQSKLERILNVIDKKMDVVKAKEEIVDIWNDVDDEDNWEDTDEREESEDDDE